MTALARPLGLAQGLRLIGVAGVFVVTALAIGCGGIGGSAQHTAGTTTSARQSRASAAPQGRLPREQIRSVVRRHLDEVRRCYGQGLRDTPQSRGAITVRFVIGASGRVDEATVSKSEIGNTAIEECIRAAVLTWRFPKPEGDGNVIVNYPFVLEPGHGALQR